MIQNILASSRFVNLIRTISSWLSGIVRSSFVFSFISRREKLSSAFNSSSIGAVLNNSSEKLTNSLKRIGAFLDKALANTLTLWLVKWVGERFYALFYVFMIAHSLLFFEFYRNPITVAAIVILFISLTVRTAFSKDTSLDLKRIDPAFLLYFAAILFSALFSLFGSGASSASITTSILYLSSILFTFIIANSFNDKKRLYHLINTFVYSTFIMSVYGIYQFIKRVPVDTTQVDQTTGGASMSMGRVSSTLGNPNVLAGWLILVIPFMVSFFFIAKGFWRKLLFFPVVAAAIACLTLTLSRSGWVGLVVAAAVYLFLLNWRLIPVFIVLGVASLPFMPRFILDRMTTIGADTSSVYRFSLWAGSFRMALDNWLTGIGIGLEYFQRYFKNYIYMQYDQNPVHSHMLILQIWLESGICAVFSFLWFCIRLIKKALLSSVSGAGKSDIDYLIMACISSVVGFLALGFFEYVWFFPRCMNMFFIVIGVFMCALDLKRASPVTQVGSQE